MSWLQDEVPAAEQTTSGLNPALELFNLEENLQQTEGILPLGLRTVC